MSAEFYDRYWSDQGYGPEGELAPTTRDLLEKLVPPGSSVVDVGCGDGRAVGLWAQKRGCDYLGLDVSDTAVAKARALGLRAERIDDARALPLPSSETRVVTQIEVLEHLFDPLSAVAEARRILKPGGLFVASVPNAAYWIRRVELAAIGRFNPYGHDASASQPWIDPHIRFFTRGTLRAMLQSAGFDDIHVRGGAHPVFSLRTRVEAVPIWRWMLLRWPSMLAPALLVDARNSGGEPPRPASHER